MGRTAKWTKRVCVVCQREFLTKPWSDHKLCGNRSSVCAREWNRRFHVGKSPGNKGVPLTEGQKRALSLAHKGKKQKPETVAKRAASNRGKKRNPSFGKMMSERYMGEGNPMWRGGAASLRERNNLEMQTAHKKWRAKVFERDNYLCVVGGLTHGKDIQADHIKPFALFPELRWEISNGQTLCRKCHGKKTSAELKMYWKNQYAKSDYWKLLPQTDFEASQGVVPDLS